MNLNARVILFSIIDRKPDSSLIGFTSFCAKVKVYDIPVTEIYLSVVNFYSFFFLLYYIHVLSAEYHGMM